MLKILAQKYKIIATATPWGASQDAYKLMTGLIWYGTAGHGGLYVSKALADKKLSPNARAEGIKYAGAYWYEEDVQWVIPFYENPEWLKLAVEKRVFSSEPSKEEMKSSIERWMPDYFKAQKEGIVEFKALKQGDLIYFDRADAKPYTVKDLMGSKAIVERDGNRYQVSKTMYFNRAVKVEQK